MASVDLWPRLNNAAPSLQPHYRTFLTTTGCSAPVLRIGTPILAVLAACDLSLDIGAQVHLQWLEASTWLPASKGPPSSLVQLRTAYTQGGARDAVDGAS